MTDPRPSDPFARARRRCRNALGAGALALGLCSGCLPSEGPSSTNGLIVTQVPVDTPARAQAPDILELRYPQGSRIALVPLADSGDDAADRIRVLSTGLASAGNPVLGPDGDSVLFSGRAQSTDPWQIYRASLRARTAPPQPVTSMPGGAMDPAWMPDNRLVFSSPVPSDRAARSGIPPALYSQSLTGGPPERLSHGLLPAGESTVLRDGRILFVSAVPRPDDSGPLPMSLFTVNSDGTEIAGFAAQHDGPAALWRPRELPDGRLVFLSGGVGVAHVEGRIEQVLMAQPYRSRSVTFPQITDPCRAVESDLAGGLLATLRASAAPASFAVYRLAPGATSTGAPIFDDPVWHEVEAITTRPPPTPMGRIASVNPERDSGLVLCLDARLSDPRTPGPDLHSATSARVVAHRPGQAPITLGTTALQSDGSFLVEVPADLTFSVELLDPDQHVLRRCAPTLWVRPGENRSCVGCHEPHNRAPENLRPLAVAEPPVRLEGPGVKLTVGAPNP